ncbi:MAG: sulfatase [Verrucomicrobia bacterium]|nr:sulfatase [Verrucomicrobiota bacterium]MDA1066612.1 sulfatase [Verrucomicrobiota bacterium]
MKILRLKLLLFLLPCSFLLADSRPNILWIIIDDMSANFSSYGETLITTPHVDKLAENGVKFTKAFVTAPVCSTNRSAFITGMYQTSIGAHQHRSGRGELKINLPNGIRPIPELFQEAGYYTAITGWPSKSRTTIGKTDYNFEWDKAMYEGADWSKRKEGQPFFAQVQLPGGKHRGGDLEGSRKFVAQFEKLIGKKTNPKDVSLPPYYPRDPALLEDWAAYLDTVRYTDHFVGEIVQRLKDEGDYENTVVLFMTDHGISHARGKQFMYEEGLHVPLVVAGPGIKPGQVRDDLVEHIDIAALSLGLAGIDIPNYMQAKDILSKSYKKRSVIFAARDRCDETVEHLRAVRSDRYKYIRNFLDQRPHMQPNRYKDKKDIVIALRTAHENGSLTEVQDRIFNPTRPKEELYDLKNDPFEINNLADDPKHQNRLLKFRKQLESWMKETNDHGPESEAMYDSDMAVYTNSRNEDPEAGETLVRNIATMKQWAAEGK